MSLPPWLPDDAVTAIYLHGFASSPESSKAIRIADALRDVGVATHIPDLNQPSFRALTVTRMIEQVRALVDTLGSEEPVVLIGSSLGGFVAVHTAAVDPRVKGLLLMAPALDFGADENDRIGSVSISDWRAAGSCEVFHYAWNRPETLDFALYEDAARYDAFGVELRIPALVFQGLRDTVVDPRTVIRWKKSQRTVTLAMLQDDHQLQASIGRISLMAATFVAALGKT